MQYNLFLFDLDDTLLDFQASEKLSFGQAFGHLGYLDSIDEIHDSYKFHNNSLWKQFENNEISKDFLRTERFKRTLHQHKIDIPATLLADTYLDSLPRNVVLIDGAIEILKFLQPFGEIGVITNGIEITQKERIKNSELKKYIDFLVVSEECGFAKPDKRFFEYAFKKASNFSKGKTIVIGDRLETDILGANLLGIDSCWFNPEMVEKNHHSIPTYIINDLTKLKNVFS